MTRPLTWCALIALTCLAQAIPAQAIQNPELRRPSLTFVENRGQWPEVVRFAAGFGPASVWITADGAVVDLVDLEGPDGGARGCALRLAFDGCQAARLVAEDLRTGRHHYLFGAHPGSWRTDVRGYARLRFEEVWPGVDVVLREGQGLFEYDLELAPGAELPAARLRLEGAAGLSLDDEGRLVIETAFGSLTQTAPVAWTRSAAGERTPVPCRFRILGEDTYGFEAPEAQGDESLVVDPGLIWSTYLGDLDHDLARALTRAPGGDVICTGSTFSPAYPTSTGAYDFSWNGAFDAFVTRLSPDGSSLVWSTFLGGSGQDNGMALDVGPLGEIVVVGDTTSSDFPTSAAAYDAQANGGLDAFVVRLQSGGSFLLAATYLGTAAGERATAVEVDGAGRILVCGSTGSAAFPTTTGAYDRTFGGGSTGAGDAFVARFSADLASLDFSTFLGGAVDERARSLALGSDGRITVAGWTTSLDFPTTVGVLGAASAGGRDGFVSRLAPDGQALVWSTYFGGSGDDTIADLALASNQDCVVVGGTDSSDLVVTPQASQATPGGLDEGFVARLAGEGGLLAYSTYLGGSQDDVVNAVALLEGDAIAVTGRSNSPDLAVQPWAYDTGLGGLSAGTGADAFVFRYGKQGDLEYATYFGGRDEEAGLDIVSDGQGGVLFCGETNSGDFPTPYGSFDSSYDYSTIPDGFVSHLDFARYPFRYGAPKINSVGGWASLFAQGFPSLADDNFMIWVAGALSNDYGWFFWSDQPGSLPLAGGELLMLPPLHRLQYVNLDIFGSAGVGVPIDAGMIGATRYFQVWYHDANDPWRAGLSEGLEVTFYP